MIGAEERFKGPDPAYNGNERLEKAELVDTKCYLRTYISMDNKRSNIPCIYSSISLRRAIEDNLTFKGMTLYDCRVRILGMEIS
jgi:hypothetical protein